MEQIVLTALGILVAVVPILSTVFGFLIRRLDQSIEDLRKENKERGEKIKALDEANDALEAKLLTEKEARENFEVEVKRQREEARKANGARDAEAAKRRVAEAERDAAIKAKNEVVASIEGMRTEFNAKIEQLQQTHKQEVVAITAQRDDERAKRAVAEQTNTALEEKVQALEQQVRTLQTQVEQLQKHDTGRLDAAHLPNDPEPSTD